MEIIETIERLANLRCVSGYEGELSSLMSREFQRCGGRIGADRIGNVWGCFGPEKSGRRVMVCAHTDEVGLIVKYIDNDGMIYFDLVGMVNPVSLSATPVDICAEKGIVQGVISARSRHLLSAEEMNRAPKMEELWIETGANTAEEVSALGVQIGDSIAFRPNFQKLANGYFSSKSIDDRVGCAILLHLAERLKSKQLDYQLYLTASVQEEVGARGAGVAARRINPDIALIIDTVPAGEPLMQRHRATAIVGRGPVLRAMDTLPTFQGTLYSPRLRRLLKDVAERQKIPYQIDVAQTWTDASAIHVQSEGIPCAGIFIPRHGGHSALEIASMSDVENALQLIDAFLTGLDSGVIAGVVSNTV